MKGMLGSMSGYWKTTLRFFSIGIFLLGIYTLFRLLIAWPQVFLIPPEMKDIDRRSFYVGVFYGGWARKEGKIQTAVEIQAAAWEEFITDPGWPRPDVDWERFIEDPKRSDQ